MLYSYIVHALQHYVQYLLYYYNNVFISSFKKKVNGEKGINTQETFSPADGLPLTSIYKYQLLFKKSTENENFYKKIRASLSKYTDKR